jgi:DNA-binding NarL/FixJ family response regulator
VTRELATRWRAGNTWLQDGVLAVALAALAFAPPLAANGVALDPAAPGEDHPLAALTEREREVLTHIAAGLSNAEIAGALVISQETVKTYVSRILAKLNLRDRVQAVVFAFRTGLVSAQDSCPP